MSLATSVHSLIRFTSIIGLNRLPIILDGSLTFYGLFCLKKNYILESYSYYFHCRVTYLSLISYCVLHCNLDFIHCIKGLEMTFRSSPKDDFFFPPQKYVAWLLVSL